MRKTHTIALVYTDNTSVMVGLELPTDKPKYNAMAMMIARGTLQVSVAKYAIVFDKDGYEIAKYQKGGLPC